MVQQKKKTKSKENFEKDNWGHTWCLYMYHETDNEKKRRWRELGVTSEKWAGAKKLIKTKKENVQQLLAMSSDNFLLFPAYLNRQQRFNCCAFLFRSPMFTSSAFFVSDGKDNPQHLSVLSSLPFIPRKTDHFWSHRGPHPSVTNTRDFVEKIKGMTMLGFGWSLQFFFLFSFIFLHLSAICCILDSVSTVRSRHGRLAQT